MLRSILLIARPPLLAVMQGGEYSRFQFVTESASCPTGGRENKPQFLRPLIMAVIWTGYFASLTGWKFETRD